MSLPHQNHDVNALGQLAKMHAGDVDEVVQIEQAAYPFPWTRGNFLDSLLQNYQAWVLRTDAGDMLGYFLLMPVVDEMHLLNIAVHPDWQGRGLGRRLMDAAINHSLEADMPSILLEVRPSNLHALAVYRHLGFIEIGRRKQYYPAADGQREDAVVMRLALNLMSNSVEARSVS
jgi:ribosomal-protein-alanine N-acetyltransferase